MNYFGFLCLGLGILTLVAGMICTLLAIVSKETRIKIKAKCLAIAILPVARLLFTFGLNMAFKVLVPLSD